MNLRDESYPAYTPRLVPLTVRHVDSIRTPDSVAATDVKPASHRVADRSLTHLASGVPKAPGSAPSAPGAFVLSGGLQRIGYVHERTPGIWLWNVTVKIPGSPRTPAPESSSRQTSPLEMK